MGKKRKPELDLDVERSMYASFVTAANAVSQLYTTGIAQQRRTAVAASRATLVRSAAAPQGTAPLRATHKWGQPSAPVIMMNVDCVFRRKKC